MLNNTSGTITSVITAGTQGRCIDQLCDFKEGSGRSGIRWRTWTSCLDKNSWDGQIVITKRHRAKSCSREMQEKRTRQQLNLIIKCCTHTETEFSKTFWFLSANRMRCWWWQHSRTYRPHWLGCLSWCQAVETARMGAALSVEASHWTTEFHSLYCLFELLYENTG